MVGNLLQYGLSFNNSGPDTVSSLQVNATLTYTPSGLLESRLEKDMLSNETRRDEYTYNARGLLETIDGPRTDVTDVTTFTYDTVIGELTHITNALNQVSQITLYDSSGRPLTLSDPNGLITTLTYDARGRLKSSTVDGHTTGFTYDPVGNVTNISRPGGLSLTYSYDAARRLTGIQDNAGNRIAYTLDDAGNRKKIDVFDANNLLKRTQTRTFDEMSRMLTLTGGAGQTNTFSYDKDSRLTSLIDGRNHATLQAFDGLDRLMTQTDAAIGVVTLDYDVLGQIRKVTDPNGLETHYLRNALGDLKQLDSPDSGIITYTVDSAGNRKTQTDARGITTSYQYDPLNRLTHILYPDSSLNIVFTYNQGTNGIGRLTGMTTGANQSVSYAYDKRGNLISRTTTLDGNSWSEGWSYNGDNQLTQITYPSGRIVTYQRDTLGRVNSLT